MNSLTRVLALFSLWLLTCSASAISETATINVALAEPKVELNKNVFGQLIYGADHYGIFSIPHHDISKMHEGGGIWNPEEGKPNAAAFSILQSYQPGALRYPDGLGVHNHNWKATIGPLDQRGEWKFGLDEFMELADEIDASPIIVVSEYIGTPQDAADLVEYLNMPANAEYPWAMQRAENGHPEPYNVKFFEMGNESWVDWRKFGPSEVRTPQGVGEYASELAKAMKAVDSSILCGVPYGYRDWTAGVFPHITDDIDFFVVHKYPFRYGGGDLEGAKENLLLEAMLAGGYVGAHQLVSDHALVRELTGRDMPMMVTEYNMGPTQQIPNLKRPYRYTLASALGTGDFMGRMLDPSMNVLAANYYSWLNGAFGAIFTYKNHPWDSLEKRESPELRPMHHILELWGEYRGSRLLELDAEVSELEFVGFTSIPPLVGDKETKHSQISSKNLVENAQIIHGIDDNIRLVRPQDPTDEWTIYYEGFSKQSAYPAMLKIPLDTLPDNLKPPTVGLGYRFLFDARWEADPDSPSPNIGMQIADARGWVVSGSASVIRGVQAAEEEWQSFSTMYMPLAETKDLQILNRIEGTDQPVTGTLRIRNMKIEPWSMETLPARPALTTYASASEDGSRLFFIIFNLTLDADISAELNWDDHIFSAATAMYSEVNGPTASAGKKDVRRIIDNARMPLKSKGRLHHVFPAHSATGIVIERKR